MERRPEGRRVSLVDLALEGVDRGGFHSRQPLIGGFHLYVPKRERPVADRTLSVRGDRETLLAIDLEVLDLIQIGLRVPLTLHFRDCLSQERLVVPHASEAISALARPLARFGLSQEVLNCRDRVSRLIPLVAIVERVRDVAELGISPE